MSPEKATLTPPPAAPARTPAADAHPTQALPGTSADHLTATSAPGEGTTLAIRFHDQQTVAGRYKILRFLARGGMGEVYEALDLDLGERIALKTLNTDPDRAQQSLQRFKRELSLARKVTHPNVCRTYDFVQHLDPDGGRVACLSMELLNGETLADRLYRERRLSLELTLNLAQQMAAALVAAHTAGVIHRDLKPSNVILVKGSSGEGSLRAVVTDFGLAFSQDSFEFGGTFLGTPAYMSPEQVEGLVPTVRSDLYSLGLVIFEMLAGQAAFQGSNPISTATKRLSEDPPALNLFREDLPPFWAPVLARCLARDPEARFASAQDLLAALEPEAPRPLPVPRSPRRVLAVAASAFLLFGSGAYGAWNMAKGRPPWALPVRTRPSLAVLGFKNLGPEASAWRGTALAEMLGTELGLDEQLRLIPGDEVARMRSELGFKENAPLDRESLAMIRTRLGADLVVTGTYVDSGVEGTFRVDLKLLDARTGEVKGLLRQEGKDQDILGVVHGAGQNLRNRLGLTNDSPRQREGLIAAYPKDSEGMRLYALGLERLRSFDPKGALPLLEQALTRDASCALTHVALSEAWTLLGYDGRAKDESQLALECSSGLSREDRLRVEGRSAFALRKWDQSAEAYRTLYGFFPDNLDYGLGLAVSLAAGAHPQEAERVFDQLVKLGGTKGPDPRVLMERAEVARGVGDIPRATEWAEKALAGAKATKMGLLAARAQVRLASFAGMNGHVETAFSYLEGAQHSFGAAGDLKGLASVLHTRAMINRVNGQFEEECRTARDLGKLAESFGNARMVGISLYMLGMGEEGQGEYGRSIKTMEQSKQTLEEAGEKHSILIPMMEIALSMTMQGRYEMARGEIAKCLDRLAQTQNGRQKSFALGILSQIDLASGRFEQSEKLNQEGLELGRKLALGEEQIVNLENLAKLSLWKGDFPQAQDAIKRAKDVLRTSTYEFGRAGILLAEAQGHMEGGAYESAFRLAGDAQMAFQRMGARGQEARALLLKSRAHLAMGQRGDSRKAMETARGLMVGTETLDAKVEFAIQCARLAAMENQQGEARRCLLDGEALARRAGHVPYEWTCKLLRAYLEPRREIQMARLLPALERQGLGLLARQARIRTGTGPSKLPA